MFGVIVDEFFFLPSFLALEQHIVLAYPHNCYKIVEGFFWNKALYM